MPEPPDDGCFVCTPEKHKRWFDASERPMTCPDSEKKPAVVVSGNALSSMDASARKDRSDNESVYDNIVQGMKRKPEGHTATPLDKKGVTEPLVRLYAVTTIASSPRYGGTRTVAMCVSFDRAKEIVERNIMNIYEMSYSLVVIEGFFADQLYGGIGREQEQYWYVWEGDQDGSYRACEVPEAYKNVVNIGIG